MVSDIKALKSKNYNVVACCCGHGKYKKTIIVKDCFDNYWDIISNTMIPRTRNFYKRDKEGIYYIPEVENE